MGGVGLSDRGEGGGRRNGGRSVRERGWRLLGSTDSEGARAGCVRRGGEEPEGEEGGVFEEGEESGLSEGKIQ